MKSSIIYLGGVFISFAIGIAVPDFPARADSSAETDSIISSGKNETILFLDFEDGNVEGWKHSRSFGNNLLIEIDESVEKNTSKSVLHIKVPEKERSGSITYDLKENGIEQIALTPDIHIAWCWKVSRIIDTNGLWIYVELRNRRNNKHLTARAVNYVKYMHDYMTIYHDPPRRWMYHSESIYDYIWRRAGPFEKGDIVIESVTFGISHGPGLEAWLDNIWLGRGAPPDSINVIKESKFSSMEVDSKITSFSYGFINCDNIPDRIEVYRERADIFINPHEDKGRDSAAEGGINYTKIEPDYVITFDRQRGDGVITLADLDGDGYDDLLFQFDDLKGALCYKNDYPRAEFSNVTCKIGALVCAGEHGAGSAAADIDMDGDLDIFMFDAFPRRGLFGGVRFFRNEADFSFLKWAEESRILSEGSFGGAFGDFDGDLYQDIFINYRPLDSGDRPFISFNDGSGRFTPSAEALIAPAKIHFCSSTVADFDNDADLDIYCVSDWVAGEKWTPPNMLFMNNGMGLFEDITDSSGTGYSERTNAVLSGDFDQDGLVDIYLVNSDSPCVFYRNMGNSVFEESAAFTDFFCKIPVTNGTAADIDRDGDLDIVMLRRDRAGLIIRKNRVDNKNFLQVRLRARGKNRLGIGGGVYIYRTGFAGQKNYCLGYRDIRGANGSAVFSPPVAHFGLGEYKNVDVLVIFPPSGNCPADTVIKKNIAAGTFLIVSESSGLWGSVFCNPRADYIFSLFEIALFKLPSWAFYFIVLVIISGAGILIKNSIRPRLFNTPKVLLILLIGFVSGAALLRSIEWSFPVFLCSALIVIFSYKVEEILRRSVTSREWRDKIEEMLLDDLSPAIHTEKKFAFLADFSRSEKEITKLNPEEIDEDFKNMDKLVSLMKICSASDPAWRAVRNDADTIRLICGELILGKENEDKRRVHFHGSARFATLKHALDRLNSELVDYREKLRIKRSVSFIEEWEKLEKEYAAELEDSGAVMDVNLPDGMESCRVHLLPDEFRHIFKNLLDNSIWAVKESREKKISLNCYYEANHLVAHWRDTGAGIPESLRDLLFSAPVESSRPGGTGQGCYISRKILRRRSGLIRYEKMYEGDGTEFIVKMIKLN